MRKLIVPMFLVVLLSLVCLVAIAAAQGQKTVPAAPGRQVQGDNAREVTAPADEGAAPVPNIGFIDSPSATCYRPDPSRCDCYINWYYLSVGASPNYMITMTVVLNEIGTVANVGGFFQTSMYVPYNMLGQGFRVPCGTLGAGGNPSLGNAYAYTIRARDSANLSSANYGTVYCPACR
jgi:hypothetical protein